MNGKQKKQAGLYIIGDAPQPENYTRMPNMAIETLEVYAFKLLAVLMDIARTTSKCWLNNQELAERVGCSINHMKKVRITLFDLGYILIDEGTHSKRATVTVLFTDIWKMNAEYHEKKNPKPDTRLSPGDNQLSWDDNRLSRYDNPSKQDNITRQENKETIPPIPPTGETTTLQEKIHVVDTELLAMEQAVKTELKQSNKKQRTNVAKVLLKRYKGDESEKNVEGQCLTPERLKLFGAWWDKTKVDKDGKSLTRPKNVGTVKTWVDDWQMVEAAESLQQKQAETKRRDAKLPLNFAQLESA